MKFRAGKMSGYIRTCLNSGNMIAFVMNCKAIAGRRQNCKVYAGRSKKICKVFLGRDKCRCRYIYVYSLHPTPALEDLYSNNFVFQKKIVFLHRSFMDTGKTQAVKITNHDAL
jgi:hypothetical protein